MKGTWTTVLLVALHRYCFDLGPYGLELESTSKDETPVHALSVYRRTAKQPRSTCRPGILDLNSLTLSEATRKLQLFFVEECYSCLGITIHPVGVRKGLMAPTHDNAFRLISPLRQHDSRKPEGPRLLHTSSEAMSTRLRKPCILCTYLPTTSDPPNSTDIALLWVHTEPSLSQITSHDHVNSQAAFWQIGPG
jgi:hypothetical protein